LNRWIVPLDRHVDYLSLHTGGKFKVPFDVTVIFSSNLTPDELTDAAFARRLGYKIHIDELGKKAYREVFLQACQRADIEFNTQAFDFMVNELHPEYGQAYLPCIPHDVISKIRDRTLYLGESPRLSLALMSWAWTLYFGGGERSQAQKVHRTESKEGPK
jgi:hypothetical protein